MMKMMQEQEEAQSDLGRSSSSSCLNSDKITPSHFSRSTSASTGCEIPDMPLVSINNYRNATRDSNTNSNNNSPLPLTRVKTTRHSFTTFIRSLVHFFTFPALFTTVPTCRWMTIPTRMLSLSSPTPLGRKVTGTLFGHRKGHVTFAVQEHPRADPAVLIELPISTSSLVREMSSGLVRIALECEKPNTAGRGKHVPKLFVERVWSMYCNGRKCGYATTRACTEFDCHVLGMVQSVSVGAGVIPLVENRTGSSSEGELLYMRACFDRVVGSRDSEAFYMLNPDGNGGPELSIFLLRL